MSRRPVQTQLGEQAEAVAHRVDLGDLAVGQGEDPDLLDLETAAVGLGMRGWNPVCTPLATSRTTTSSPSATSCWGPIRASLKASSCRANPSNAAPGSSASPWMILLWSTTSSAR